MGIIAKIDLENGCACGQECAKVNPCERSIPGEKEARAVTYPTKFGCQKVISGCVLNKGSEFPALITTC